MNKILMVTLVAIFCLVISIMTFVPEVINKIAKEDTHNSPVIAPSHNPNPSTPDDIKYMFKVVKAPDGGIRVYIIFKDIQNGSISALEYIVIVDPRMEQLTTPIPEPTPTPKSPIE